MIWSLTTCLPRRSKLVLPTGTRIGPQTSSTKVLKTTLRLDAAKRIKARTWHKCYHETLINKFRKPLQKTRSVDLTSLRPLKTTNIKRERLTTWIIRLTATMYLTWAQDWKCSHITKTVMRWISPLSHCLLIIQEIDNQPSRQSLIHTNLRMSLEKTTTQTGRHSRALSKRE